MPRHSQPRYDPKRKQWSLRWKGKHRYLCYGANNAAKAHARAAKIMSSDPGDKHPVDTVVDATLTWLEQMHPGSEWHRWILKPFIEWSSGTDLADVHSEILADYLKWLMERKPAPAPTTMRRNIGFARSVLRWAHTRGHMLKPVPDRPKAPAAKEVDRDLNPDERRRILEATPKQARQVLTFMLLTGARPQEACLLNYSEIDGDRCVLRRGKTWERTGKARILYMTDEARALVETQATSRGYVFRSRLDRPYTSSGLRCIFKRAAERAKIKGVTGPYVLRHSFAQHAVDEGMSLDSVGEVIGHAPGSSETRVYARVGAARIRKEIQNLPSPLAGDLDQKIPWSERASSPARREKEKRKTRKTAKGRSRRAG